MGLRLVSSLVLAIAAVGGFLVGSCGGSPQQPSPTDALTISQVTPGAGPVGTRVTVTGSGFALQGNTVQFGQGYIRNIDSADGATLRLAVPEGLDLCPPDPTGPCPGAYPRVTPGEYAVAVSTGAMVSNSITFTVTTQ